MKPVFKWSLPLVAALTMTACGGGSSGSSSASDSNAGSGSNNDSGEDSSPGIDTSVNQFTSAAQWVVQPQTGDSLCFDFNTNAEVSCSGEDWDIRLDMGGRTPSFFTNSGESGDGSGGTLGSPFAYSWETLQAFNTGMTDNEGNALNSRAYLADSLDNAFTNSDNSIGSAVFEYTETHRLLSNYSVFLVTTDNTNAFDSSDDNVYAVQITSYYGGASGSESGYPTIRWVNVAALTADPDTTVQEVTLDASSDWVYFDLISGSTVAEPSADNWQLGFSRYSVKTNSGISGDSAAGSFFAQQPAGFYDAEGTAIISAFSDGDVIAAAEAALTDTSGWAEWGSRTAWATDAAYSSLNPDYQGAYPGLLEYGFYSYDPTGAVAGTAHMLVAAPENGVMLRSGSGNSYARMHLSSLQYADAADASSQTTWTFDFEVQPETE
ncbi:MAG: hypothetical protein CMI03_06845 [Oceanospirillaceae bacterium]|uniref:HmuY family protein n=1 Tax=unclassified Thalassolituus TaxID=2624967 RepID=UPI000C551B13|nr:MULTISPECIES: HmuY family protein [unclassified Thalassolituus]MAS25335.1 hypothetical protein [Oceanospirillaceae bacterium]MBL34681.1 hypothetical protein [Oceanospirillaceae bacterium]MBS52449.1 hypothetical protein [Oceanospirillaceae bacterium]|tara:strand:+ start:70 stop:1377 length:1308 start_codon:yes stop_codon:yes gene_type:complete